MSLDYEQQFYSKDIEYIVGCDEAGRGCFLGPVVAGAVILPRDFKCDLINGSKQLSEKQREEAYEIIKNNAIAWAVAEVSAQEIDQINILNASRKAMLMAMSKLNHRYDMILTDAVKIKTDLPFEAIIKGDAKAMCIAAASIMAKVTRDHICYELDKKYPEYQISKHKGYGTKLHMEILEKYGPIKEIYRFTYKPIKKFLIKKVNLF